MKGFYFERNRKFLKYFKEINGCIIFVCENNSFSCYEEIWLKKGKFGIRDFYKSLNVRWCWFELEKW